MAMTTNSVFTEKELVKFNDKEIYYVQFEAPFYVTIQSRGDARGFELNDIEYVMDGITHGYCYNRKTDNRAIIDRKNVEYRFQVAKLCGLWDRPSTIDCVVRRGDGTLPGHKQHDIIHNIIKNLGLIEDCDKLFIVSKKAVKIDNRSFLLDGYSNRFVKRLARIAKKRGIDFEKYREEIENLYCVG